LKYDEKERLDALIPYEGFLTDYSEEAIPERDPAYRTLDGTLCEEQTVEVMPEDVRLALARCLEQLGMSAAKAALVATL
jgi:hypothetical protein